VPLAPISAAGAGGLARVVFLSLCGNPSSEGFSARVPEGSRNVRTGTHGASAKQSLQHFGIGNLSTPADERQRSEDLLEQAAKDRSKAFELKQVLDRLGLFKEYEDRFLDLFK
jgi:hypothetical protein